MTGIHHMLDNCSNIFFPVPEPNDGWKVSMAGSPLRGLPAMATTLRVSQLFPLT